MIISNIHKDLEIQKFKYVFIKQNYRAILFDMLIHFVKTVT